MLLMPRWEEEPDDTCIDKFVEVLISATDWLHQDTDLRDITQIISGYLLNSDKCEGSTLAPPT